MAPHAVSSFVESPRLALTGVGGPAPMIADAPPLGGIDGTTASIAVTPHRELSPGGTHGP